MILAVRPQTFPIAIKLIRSESELPGKVKMPVRDLGYQMILCQAIGLTRHFGWTIAVGKEEDGYLKQLVAYIFTGGHSALMGKKIQP